MSEELSTKPKCPHQEFADGRCVRCGGRKPDNLVGQTFNGMTILEMLEHPKVRFRCFCGKIAVGYGNKIKLGRVRSCGCYFNPGKRVKHGHCRGGWKKRTPTFLSWMTMLGRCYNKNDTHHYPDYGGRGVTVCERWQGKDGFANFLADMGERPEGKTLDRFPNNNGNYEPTNCRWATRKEQQRNRRNNTILTCDGVSRVLVEWSEITGLSVNVIIRRIQKGWSAEKSLKTPTRRHRCNPSTNS